MEGTPFMPRPTILNRERKLTNKILLITFIILFVLWIPTLIYAFCEGDGSKIFPEDTRTYIKEIFSVTKFFIIIGYSVLAGLYTFLMFAAMRWIPNFSYILFATFWIPISSSIGAAVLYPTFSNVWLMIGSFFNCVFVFYLLSTEWLHLPEKILKESCKVIMFFPSGILFSIVTSFLCLLIGVVSFTAHMYLLTLASVFMTLMTGLNIIVCLWTILIILYLGNMILSGTYATYFWTANKNEIPSSTVLRSLKTFSKFHVGTAAFGTSIFGFVYTIYLLLACAISKFAEGCHRNFVCFVIYNLFDAVTMRFIITGVSVKCALNGKNYQNSASEVLNDLEEHPKRCLIVVKVMEYVIMFASAVILILMGLSLYGYLEVIYVRAADPGTPVIMLAILLGTLMFALPMFTMLFTAYNTILFCVLEDLANGDGSQERPYAMSPELQEAVNHNGPPNWYLCSFRRGN